MARILSLAAGTILDVAPFDAPAVAAAAGFDAVGIWFDKAVWTSQTPARIRQSLDEHRIMALDIEPIMLSTNGDHGDEIVDAALEIGTHSILVASREPDHKNVATRLAALAERLTGTTITLVLEFLPILAIKTLNEALSIVEAVDHPLVGVLIDSLHLSRSGSSLDLISPSNLHRFPYLQLCDAPMSLPDPTFERLMHEALHGRLLPGHGELDLAQLLRKVPDVPLSFEQRSAALMASHPDPVDRARTVFEAAATLPPD
jgi:sugar phosphate isomerase/epimerase